jgi:hypothetical protein
VTATENDPLPVIVYIDGYQNNRETSDTFAIELARRGFVVLSIDAMGRGNSGIPGKPAEPGFDSTYGPRASLDYLRALPYVDPARSGLMGHSLGAEMAYSIALEDPTISALGISGFAYTLDASPTRPKNLLMTIGQYDEYRERMTGVGDIQAEWMTSPETRQVIPADDPQAGVTYGDFAQGTARRVFLPHAIHIQESHSRPAVAEALDWMRSALGPPAGLWIERESQTWPLKEWSMLVAMLAGLAAFLPLGLILLRTRLFRPLQGRAAGDYACRGWSCLKLAIINGLLMWLYLPLILTLFAVHVYVLPIDGLFPMMMVNGMVWWFVLINFIGFFLFRRWYKRQSRETGLTLDELGISFHKDRFALNADQISRTGLLAALLFAFAYGLQHLLEAIFIVDYRIIFPFASDLTPYCTLMFLIYFPFLLLGFLLMALFLHGQFRRRKKSTWLRTYLSWTGANVLVMVVPLVLFLLVQYSPHLTVGVIPFVGQGGILASFTMNLFHIIGVLVMLVPISAWFFQLTGKIYLGAILNATLVPWM